MRTKAEGSRTRGVLGIEVRRNARVWAVLVLAVVLVGCGASSSAGSDAPSTPIEVAASFVDAYGDFDPDQAASLLGADADLSGLEGGQDDWRLGNRWLEAHGFELIRAECEELSSSSSETRVSCPFDYHAIRTGERGGSPFPGSRFLVTVSDGRVVAASMVWEFFPSFSEQVWKPFGQWVAENHPDDVAIMYADPNRAFQRLTEESILLWEIRSREYSETLGG